MGVCACVCVRVSRIEIQSPMFEEVCDLAGRDGAQREGGSCPCMHGKLYVSACAYVHIQKMFVILRTMRGYWRTGHHDRAVHVHANIRKPSLGDLI